MDELIYYSEEIKALGDGKIGGYLVRYSTANDPDLTKDYFDAKSEIVVPDAIPLLYNHGMDSTLKKRTIGRVLRTEKQDAGVWAEAQMNMRDDYEKAIYAMAEAGKLGFSSGALSHLVEREPAGKAMHIKTWFIGEASLTPTPAEYRNTVQSIKSLIPSDDAALSDAGVKQPIKSKEVNNMDEIETKAADIAAKAVADAFAKRDAEIKAQQDAEAKLQAAEEAGYKKAIEELKNRKAPAFNTITERGFSEEKDAVPAFKHWLASGEKNGGLIEPDTSFGNIKDAKAAWNVTTGASGGFLVPDPLYTQIIAKRSLQSWVRQAPVQTFSTNSDHLLVPRENTSHTAFVLTAEAAAYDENEGTVSQKDLILYKYTKLTKVNEEFLMYNQTNWESWFTSAMARAEAVTENTFTISGTGSGQPEGLSAGATASALTIKTSAQLNPEDLTALIGKLGAGYNVPSECGFIGANASKWYLKNAILAGPFAYASNNGNQGAPDFFGYNFYTDDDVQSYTATSGVVLYFGNLSYYGMVEKPGMVIQRNPYLYMANGQVGIFASIFRGGGVLQAEAIYSVNGK